MVVVDLEMGVAEEAIIRSKNVKNVRRGTVQL